MIRPAAVAGIRSTSAAGTSTRYPQQRQKVQVQPGPGPVQVASNGSSGCLLVVVVVGLAVSVAHAGEQYSKLTRPRMHSTGVPSPLQPVVSVSRVHGVAAV